MASPHQFARSTPSVPSLAREAAGDFSSPPAVTLFTHPSMVFQRRSPKRTLGLQISRLTNLCHASIAADLRIHLNNKLRSSRSPS